MIDRLLAALALVPLAAPAAVAAQPPVVVEEQLIMPADGPYRVKIENLKGHVVVRGWNKNVVYVKATRRATHPLAGSEAQIFAAIKPEFKRPEANGVTVTTRFTGYEDVFPAVMLTRAPHVVVDYELLVPPETAVELAQEAGDVTVYGTDGRLDIFTRDGAIAVTEARGRIEAKNERGAMRFAAIDGDAIAFSQHGHLSFADVSGDVKAATHSGDVRIDVDPRFTGEVSFQTVSGVFRSDLVTFNTDLEPGDRGYEGILRGPLAGRALPEVRFRIDTVSGTATVANARSATRR